MIIFIRICGHIEYDYLLNKEKEIVYHVYSVKINLWCKRYTCMYGNDYLYYVLIKLLN